MKKQPLNYKKKNYDVRSYKNNKNVRETIEKRYNILIILIAIIMAIITVNLFVIQIIRHDFYGVRLNQLTGRVFSSNSTPRGRIYDRHGRIIVDNEAVKVIYYRKTSESTTAREIEMAYKLAEMIELPNRITDANLRNFWVLNNRELSNAKISSEEWTMLEERRITRDDIDIKIRERITEEELNEYNEIDRLAAYIYTLMNTGYGFADKIIKQENVTDREFALIAENRNNLPGFDVRLDWNRVYPYGDVFRSILGSVSTTETGIPYELKDHYLSLGYSLDDRVGLSFLEFQYESVLRGTKTRYTIGDDGRHIIIDEGSRGNDIMLTIDIELQKEVEQIIREEIIRAKREPNTRHYRGSYVIISNPKTGEILAMSGQQLLGNNLEEPKFLDNTPGILTNPVTVGSSIKGASHIVGYNNNALQIGEYRIDRCIKIASTPAMCSWIDMGRINDITAMSRSSNVYQFLTAINVGGGRYVYDRPLPINEGAFDIYRNTFAEFGLGVRTGIDLPVESIGYKGTRRHAGLLMAFAIGQYDTYTTIQLMQYVNTIANNGYRVRPHLLKAIYRPTRESLTDIISETTPTVLNKVQTETRFMQRVQEGFREVMRSGTGAGLIDLRHNPAGKTGTSESFIDTTGDGIIDTETMSNTFVAYAPFDNPRVSFTIVSPDIFFDEGRGTFRTPVNRRITTRISQAYFEIYR